jgi:ribosomal protein S18 acetylase RimI-like enzyme
VDPMRAPRGAGTQLLREAERLIALQGGRLVIAETSSQPSYERARGFYSRNGYEQVAVIRDYYDVGDSLIIYGKYLTQQGA